MADESEKKSSGAGEELDGDWDKKEDTAPGGPKAKRTSESGTDDTAAAKGAEKSAPKDEKPVAQPVDDDGDDEQDDEDDEDDEDGEEAARDSTDDGSSGPPRRSAPPQASDDWIPEWAPWAVLGAILAVGVAGGLGAFTGKANPNAETAADTTASATATAANTAQQPGANAAQGDMIEARHLLVMYKGSMRAPDSITRTKDEAKKRAQEALAKIKAGQPFDKIVGEYSDEPGAAQRGGKLGRFRREQMVKPFSDAAFALKVGEVSGIVETSFGFHVIQRTQ